MFDSTIVVVLGAGVGIDDDDGLVCHVCVVFTEPSLSPKQKEHRKWKGKVVKKFKRHSSSSAVVTSDPHSQADEISGTFGIPLECCCLSLANEVYFCIGSLVTVVHILKECAAYSPFYYEYYSHISR